MHYTADPAAIPPPFRDGATLLGAPRPRSAPPPPVNEPPPAAPLPLQATPGAPITVEAHLNGVRLTLIVDTGADRTVLSPEAIERAGLTGQPSRAIQIVGVTGASTAPLMTIPLLDVAGARVGPLAVVVHALPATLRGTGGADGLLGRDVLDAFTLSVDTASGRATLTHR